MREVVEYEVPASHVTVIGYGPVPFACAVKALEDGVALPDGVTPVGLLVLVDGNRVDREEQDIDSFVGGDVERQRLAGLQFSEVNADAGLAPDIPVCRHHGEICVETGDDSLGIGLCQWSRADQQ